MVKDRVWQAFEDTGDPVAWLLYKSLDERETVQAPEAKSGRTDKPDGGVSA